MSLFAMALILTAAFVHASWNYLAKRSGGSAGFVWAYSALSVVMYAPLALFVLISQNIALNPTQLFVIAASGLIQACYFLALQQGYRVGDFSLVYPLARGTGPMLSTTAAILFLGERPSWVAIAGAVLIVGGVFLLTWSATGGSIPHASGKPRTWAIGFGLLIGALIAIYTLWDKNAVSALAIPPLVYENFGDLSRALILSPIGLSRWDEVKREWREHRAQILGVAFLSPLGYLLVLTAMVTTPVSYVAPARELSILIGAIMGARLLSEGDARRRLAAAGAIVAGVIALALG